MLYKYKIQKNLISMLQRNDIFPYKNNKGVDQPAHLLDLISATDQPAHPLDLIIVIVVQCNLSGVVRKPFFVFFFRGFRRGPTQILERHRSACASIRSDQHNCCSVKSE